ncbi:MAG TPA: ImmA/IrrE family metallo-endopeptidase [Candidatus Kapabacteria bacterium]|nr:ImmA/IrrE family metallo-endopeptidase [Candidatus Kapabacteria bacterium]
MSNESILLEQARSLISQSEGQTFGQFLKSKLADRDISERQLANILGMELLSVQRILNDVAKKIDAKTLLQLSEFLGIDPKVLLSVYVSSASSEDSDSIVRARKAGFLTEYLDLKKLKEIGFIQDIRDYDTIEKRLLSFFNISSLGEYAAMHSLPLFSRTRGKKSDRMLTFWLSIVNARMQSINNPNPFDSDRLEKIIPLFRAATTDVANGFKSAIRTLYDCGVTVIVESYLTTTSIRGGTFIKNGQPYIFLTKHPDWYDTLWFALLHELSHVLFDMEVLRKGTGTHLSGEANLFEDPLLEPRADEFAVQLLLTKERLEYAKTIIHIDGFVKSVANEWNVHPSIIYGMHCYKHPEDFVKYQRYRLKADEALKFNYTSWQKPTLQETVPEIEKSFALQS